MASSIYAVPRRDVAVGDCDFYHTIHIPGHGVMTGPWNLGPGVEDYLGAVSCQGKRVLELGTANGFLCFELEKRGAEVVAVDLSEDQSWDVVPFARRGDDFPGQRKQHLRRLNNAFWLAHQAFSSRARVVYSTVYDLPEEIGPVDMATFGCILLHLRDPFRALQSGLRFVRETVIITDPLSRRYRFPFNLFGHLTGPSMHFLPRFRQCQLPETWWSLSPALVQEFIGVLGFEKSEVRYHRQVFQGRKVPFYTVVGRRTVPFTFPEPPAEEQACTACRLSNPETAPSR